jgi:flagellar motor protein MotB
MVYVQEKDSGSWKGVELFSKELTTILNEGPATFTSDGKTIYYARNTIIEGKFKDINAASNTMGVFSAQLKNGVWTNIQAFPFNSDDYSLGTPALSLDEHKLYFASDMPGGYGGTDIYYSEFKDGEWQKPVNLGKQINTSGNESYPFVSQAGKLFFSSDGLPGFGGKDIFYSVELAGKWQSPIHLEATINSSADDFGLVTDVNFEQGFFSSNRKHSQDIYAFKSEFPQFGYCDTLRYQSQCFEFFDERFTDTLHLKHEWNFGGGIIKEGYAVEHCFPEPGDYEVVLTIKHKLADSVFNTKAIHRFTIENKQPVFMKSPTLGVVGETMLFEGLVGELDGFKPEQVYWNFNNGFNYKGEKAAYAFKEAGKHTILLGLSGQKDSYGRIPQKCFTKEIVVLADYQELASKTRERTEDLSTSPKGVVNLSQVENKNGVENFRMQRYLFATTISGLDNDRVDRAFREFTDLNLEWIENELSTASVEIVKDIAGILKANSTIGLFVAVHSNNKGAAKTNLQTTMDKANQLKKLLIENEVDPDRITCVGYGDTRPELNNKEENARYINQRIEFIVIDNKVE